MCAVGGCCDRKTTIVEKMFTECRIIIFQITLNDCCTNALSAFTLICRSFVSSDLITICTLFSLVDIRSPYLASACKPSTVSCVPSKPPLSFRCVNNHLKYGKPLEYRPLCNSANKPYDVNSTFNVFDDRPDIFNQLRSPFHDDFSNNRFRTSSFDP